jgi:hypothetical protein
VSVAVVSLSNLRGFITCHLPALFLVNTNVTRNHTSQFPAMPAACPAEIYSQNVAQHSALRRDVSYTNFHTLYNSKLVRGETPLVRRDSFTYISHYRHEHVGTA